MTMAHTDTVTPLYPYTMKTPTHATIPPVIPKWGLRGVSLPDPLAITPETTPNDVSNHSTAHRLTI
jgi:hypothetical protein